MNVLFEKWIHFKIFKKKKKNLTGLKRNYNLTLICVYSLLILFVLSIWVQVKLNENGMFSWQFAEIKLKYI